jgi:hypothetical protein
VIWRFPEATVEDDAGRLHRVGCERLSLLHAVDWHVAGMVVYRAAAPLECWACQPVVEIRAK